MSSRWSAEKNAVVEAAQEMAALGLVTGTSGNVSVRLPDLGDASGLLAITPTGIPYGELTEESIAVTDFDVEPVEGELPPSSESLLHVAIYRARPDVGAVIHTHSVYSSVIAVSGIDIPPLIDEMVVAIGGAVKVSQYGFPGSEQLADNVCEALGPRNAALVKNHGAVGVGRDLREALAVCTLLERVAQIFVFARMSGRFDELPREAVEAERAIYNMRRENREDSP